MYARLKQADLKTFLVDTFIPLLLVLTLIPSMMLNAVHLQQEYSGRQAFADTRDVPVRLDGVITQEPKEPKVVAPTPDVAKAVISAPKEGKVGQLIEVSAAGSTGTAFKWVVRGVDPANVRVFEKSVVFSSPDSALVDVFVAVALGNTLAVEHTSISVYQVVIPPSPPDPLLPVVKTLKSEIAPLISEVDTDDKLKELREIAGAFKQVAVLIKDGAVESAEDAVRITKALVKKATTTAGDAWKKVISRIEQETEDAAKAGKLKTLEDHARHWEMISNALDPNPSA